MSTKIDIKSIKKSSTRTEWTITTVSAFSISKPFYPPAPPLARLRTWHIARLTYCVYAHRNMILIDRINKWAVSNTILRSDFSSSSLLFSHRALTNGARIEIGMTWISGSFEFQPTIPNSFQCYPTAQISSGLTRWTKTPSRKMISSDFIIESIQIMCDVMK